MDVARFNAAARALEQQPEPPALILGRPLTLYEVELPSVDLAFEEQLPTADRAILELAQALGAISAAEVRAYLGLGPELSPRLVAHLEAIGLLGPTLRRGHAHHAIRGAPQLLGGRHVMFTQRDRELVIRVGEAAELSMSVDAQKRVLRVERVIAHPSGRASAGGYLRGCRLRVTGGKSKETTKSQRQGGKRRKEGDVKRRR